MYNKVHLKNHSLVGIVYFTTCGGHVHNDIFTCKYTIYSSQLRHITWLRLLILRAKTTRPISLISARGSTVVVDHVGAHGSYIQAVPERYLSGANTSRCSGSGLQAADFEPELSQTLERMGSRRAVGATGSNCTTVASLR